MCLWVPVSVQMWTSGIVYLLWLPFHLVFGGRGCSWYNLYIIMLLGMWELSAFSMHSDRVLCCSDMCAHTYTHEEGRGGGGKEGAVASESFMVEGAGTGLCSGCRWPLLLLGFPSTVELSSVGWLRRASWERLPSGCGRVWRDGSVHRLWEWRVFCCWGGQRLLVHLIYYLFIY